MKKLIITLGKRKCYNYIPENQEDCNSLLFNQGTEYSKCHKCLLYSKDCFKKLENKEEVKIRIK